MKTPEQCDREYLQCLIDLKEYIDEVSTEDEPPTIKEIIRDFVELKKSEHQSGAK